MRVTKVTIEYGLVSLMLLTGDSEFEGEMVQLRVEVDTDDNPSLMELQSRAMKRGAELLLELAGAIGGAAKRE